MVSAWIFEIGDEAKPLPTSLKRDSMKRLIERLRHDDRGLTATESGLIALVELVGIVVALQVLGNVVKTSFNTVGSAINSTSP